MTQNCKSFDQNGESTALIGCKCEEALSEQHERAQCYQTLL